MKAIESAQRPKGPQKQEITFPHTFTRYSVSVKIYKTPHHDYDAFTLVYYKDSVRKRVVFTTFEAALKEAESVARLLGSKNVDVLELRSADRATYLRARELLDPFNVSLEVAAAQYAHARMCLGDTPLSTAVEFYMRRHPSKIVPIPVKVVVDEFLAAKAADGCGVRYVDNLRYSLNKFAARFQGNIGAVAGGEVDAWLRGSGLSPRTRNNLRTALHTLFAFAEGRRYLPKDHDELDSVAVVNDREGEIEVFTPAELTEILCCASEPMIPFLVLAAFAGIRHAEIQRLEWKDLRLDDGIIEIEAAKAKTASRRLVPILPNLKEWLLKCRQPSGLVVPYSNVALQLGAITERANQLRRQLWGAGKGVTEEELKRADEQAKAAVTKRPGKAKVQVHKSDVPPGAETAGIEGWEPFVWKHNALRHSFISYRLAAVQNTAQVALEAGNSPQMIFRHYRELVRPVDAEKWFGVTPTSVEAVESLRTASGDQPKNFVALPVVAA